MQSISTTIKNYFLRMKKLTLMLLVFGFGVLSKQTYAQSLLSAKDDSGIIASGVLFDGINDAENWAVFADEDNRKFYIDLEKLHIYLDKITVFDESNDKVVFTDNLWNLTPNTIYEMDFQDLLKGKYRLEFQTVNDEKFFKNFEIKK